MSHRRTITQIAKSPAEARSMERYAAEHGVQDQATGRGYTRAQWALLNRPRQVVRPIAGR